MLDALGRPQSLLLLGGTSDIAVAIARRYLSAGPLRVVVAARPSAARDSVVATLRDAGADVEAVDFEARDTESHRALVEEVWSSGDIDISVVAFGQLGSTEDPWRDHQGAVELAEVNYVGAVSIGVLVADRIRAQGHGALVALSSVAGERVRRSNFMYGSTKAGMDGFFLGLGEALAPYGGRVLVVRPGFVHTKMTSGLEAAPLAVTADQVAAAVVRGLAGRKEIVWVPGAMRGVMSLLRHVPRPIFRKLPL